MRKEYPDAVVLPAPPRCRRRRTSVAQEGEDPDEPAGDRASAGPRRAAPTQASTTPRTTSARSSTSPTQDARWFSAVQGRRRHRHHRRRPRRGVPPARPREDVRAAACSRCGGSVRLARKFNRMRKVYRDALPVLSSKQKWETVLPGSSRRPMAETPTRGEDAALVAVQSALADRPGVLAGARGLSHFGEHSIGWVAVVGARRAAAAAAAPGVAGRRGRARSLAHAAAVVIKRVVQARTPASPGGRRQRRHAEPAELPVRARHVDHRGVDPAGAASPGCRCPRCWCRRWRCPAWCSACTTPATCSPAWRSARSSRRRSAPSPTGSKETHEHLK